MSATQTKPARVAIVGSGVSACAAAWLLDDHVDVTILERSSFIGGHGYTPEVELDGVTEPLDIGVQIMRPDMTPTIFALLEADPRFADVRMIGTSVSLGAVTDRCDRSTYFSNSPVLRRTAPFAADWSRLEAEISRFEQLTAHVSDALRMTPIGAWVDAQGFSQEFVEAVLIPSMSVVNVTRNGLLDALFVTNLETPSTLVGLLSPTTWFRVEGGVRRLRAILLEGLAPRVRLGAEVIAVEPDLGAGVRVTTREADFQTSTEVFDKLIWTGDLPCARAALESAPGELAATHALALGPFATEPAWVYVHRDPSWLPHDLPSRTACVFVDREGERTMHYDLNILQGRHLDPGLWVTLRSGPAPHPPNGLVVPPIEWQHPRNTPATFLAQRELHRVQGLGGVYYAGAGTCVDGFDNAFISGCVIAERLCPASRYPFHRPKTPQQTAALAMYHDMVDVWMFPD